MTDPLRRLLFNAFLLTVCLLPAWGQTATGEIDLTVLDPAGAAVPRANVEIRSADAGNLVRTLSTNEAGSAVATFLPPDTYDLRVTAQGFDPLTQKGVPLHVGQTATLTFNLKLGGANQAVTVVGEAALVEQKSTTLAQVTEERQIAELPLNGRNYLQLANLTAGTVPSTGSRDNSFSAYGNSGLQNAFLLDGARNDNYLRGLDNRARDMVRPPLDSVSEFTVQTSNYSAEFGASAGGVVNVITKSGTNRFHGSAYDFLRNDNLDAANYFAVGAKPLLVQNQYGGSLGGPVRRNRLWLFGAYEGLHDRSQSAARATVPTPAMRAGSFATPIYDPSTLSGGQRTLFPNNTIPASQFNQLGLQILNEYPLPNLPGSANNYASEPARIQQSHNAIARGDTQVSSKDSMFVRFAITRGNVYAETALPLPAQTPANQATNSEGISYGYTRTFSPTVVNEFRFNWTRLTLAQDATQPLNPIIPGSLDPAIHSSTPTIGVSGYAGLGAEPACCNNDPLAKSSGVWDISNNISKSHGRHLLKAGVDVQFIRPSTESALNGRGSFTFSGVFSQNPASRSGTGSGVADLLLGYASGATTGTIANAVERGKYAGGYFNDQWSVTRNLTLNLGVRYEVFFPYTEVNNRMGNFILEPGDPNYGHIVFAGLNGQSRSLLSTDWNNVAPRVGLAYTMPKTRLVIRGAYGIFYAQDQGMGVTNRLTSNPPFFGYGGFTIVSDQLNPSTGFILNPNQSLPRAAPIAAQQFALQPSATVALVSWYPHDTTPYEQEWNISVQKQITSSSLIEIDYVGNSSTHLWGVSQGNQPLTNGPGSATTRRPLAQYTVASVKRLAPWARSNYEGLSARFEKRYSHGFNVLSSFTYGRAIDDQNPALDLCDGCGSGDTLQNSYNLLGQRAPSDNNVPLRFVLSGVYELPFGAGKPWLHSGWAGKVAGGWSFATIYQTQSGLPFTISLPFDNANAGTVSYPNRVCNGTLSSPTIHMWYDPSCFVAPAAYVFGNSGRNILRGPIMNNLDLALHRDFKLPFESAILQFRMEAFNSLNHPQFGLPNSTILQPATATITSTSVANRILQFAMRVSF